MSTTPDPCESMTVYQQLLDSPDDCDPTEPDDVKFHEDFQLSDIVCEKFCILKDAILNSPEAIAVASGLKKENV